MRLHRRALLLVSVVASASMMTRAAEDGTVPAPDTTLECIQPSLAGGGTDAFVTCGRGETVFIARAIDGTAFGPLHPVGRLTSLALGLRRGPRVALTSRGLVVTAIGAMPGSTTHELVAWRSSDRGHSWTGPVRISDVPDAAREGLHALGASAGTASVAWLDIRHGRMRVYASVSPDGGATWSPNSEFYASPGGAVCTCCHPSVVVDADGQMSVMFRNDLDGRRDMYLKSGSQPAQQLGVGHWTLAACPMDGGGIARSPGGRVLTVWRREQTVFEVVPGEAEQPVGEGKDPAVAFAGERPVVAWTSPFGLVLRQTALGAPTLVDASGGFASIVGLGDRTAVLAWQHGDHSIVRRLPPVGVPEGR